MLEEPQLNGRIASVINKITNSAGWQAREELRGALRGPKTKPDVLITRADGPPIVLETEYAPAATVADDYMKSIGRELDPAVADAAGKVSAVIAIRATNELHQCATGDDAQRMLEDGHEIEYVVYQGNEREQTRFPQSGYIRGNIRDLVDADTGKAIRVRVSFTDDEGNAESRTSAATAAVAAAVEESEPTEPTEPPPAPTNLTAQVNGDGHIVLSRDAPDDDSVTGYQILRRRPTEGEDTLLVYAEDTGSTATTYTDTNVTAGVKHVYRVKAINAAGVSPVSNYVNPTP